MNASNEFLKCACVYCGQHVEYPAHAAGEPVSCPSCQQSLVLPTPAPRPPPAPPPVIPTLVPGEPATEKQKDRLRSFGYTFPPSISKEEASRLIDQGYRTHSPTTEQLQKLERLRVLNQLPPNATRGDARDLLRSAENDPPSKEQIQQLEDAGFKVVKNAEMTAGYLDDWLSLGGAPPDPHDLETVKHYGLKFSGDGFAAAVLAGLIQHLQELVDFVGDEERSKIARACIVAMRDPDYSKITFKMDEMGLGVTATWPKAKIREWFRRG